MSDYEKAMQLAQQGLGARKIAKIINRNSSTIHNWIKNGQRPWNAWTENEKKELHERQTRKVRTYWKGKIGAMKGRKFTEEHKQKLAKAKWGEKNPMWKGDKAGIVAGRQRARKRYNAKKGYDIHHIDDDPLNNDPDNVLILTRKEHMELDGRLDKLMELNKK